MIVAPGSSLADLARSRAEWRPWFDVLEAVREAARDPAWDTTVPSPAADAVPVLAGATVTVPARQLSRWLGHLFTRAAGEAPGHTARSRTSAPGRTDTSRTRTHGSDSA